MPMENGSEQPQAAEHQSSWWIGYYRALNGVPFAQNEVDIRAMRKARKMTQVDLAAKLGVAQAAISRWESGEVTPTSDSLHKILRAFSDCSVSD
jgi:DNA-binding transcriptional regulator YiaG